MGVATDDCDDPEDLTWTYQIELVFGGASIPLTPVMDGNQFSMPLDFGSYKINWTVTDRCGNTSSASKLFTLSDTQKPQPVCQPIARNINPGSGSVEVSASSFNNGSNDNCDNQLAYSMRIAGTNSVLSESIVFDCDDVGDVNVEIWVKDDSGNAEFCTAILSINDPTGSCNINAVQLVTAAGVVVTPDNIAVESVHVTLEGVEMQDQKDAMTPYSGDYAFENLLTSDDYTITVDKNDDYANGVSALDLVLIQRHILGIKQFDSPYKLIAADASNDERITSVDLVLLRRLILGQIDRLPDNQSWRFVKKDHTFLNPLHPWPFQEVISFHPSGDMMHNDFVGIKVGDVDQNAIANSRISNGRSTQNFILQADIEESLNQVVVELKSTEDIEWLAMQLSLSFDQDAFRLIDVASNLFRVESSMYHINDQGLNFVGVDPDGQDVSTNSTFLTLTFAKKDRGSKQVISIGTDSESFIYDTQFSQKSVSIEKSADDGSEVILYQNRPNPFQDVTTVEFYLPHDGQAEFGIFDIGGQQVYHYRGGFSKGLNRIEISRSDFGLSKGIYYYQIKTQSRSLIKKMIIL